jgi:hypothetical protein
LEQFPEHCGISIEERPTGIGARTRPRCHRRAWRLHVAQPLLATAPRFGTPDVVEFRLSQVLGSPGDCRADARLDRLTIGPQVTNLPHTRRGKWVSSFSLAARSAETRSGVRRFVSALPRQSSYTRPLGILRAQSGLPKADCSRRRGSAETNLGAAGGAPAPRRPTGGLG